jgi:hypothetical protein
MEVYDMSLTSVDGQLEQWAVFNLAMIAAAFATEDNTPLSPVSYRFQQSMPPDVRYGNCNNDFLREASKMPEF